MARITVPRAEALTTALGDSARESLVTLARALAEQAESTVDPKERLGLYKFFVQVVGKIEHFDRMKVSEARNLARSEAAIDWMARRDEQRAMVAAQKVAEKLAREQPKPSPTSSIIDELRAARERKTKRGA